MGSPPRVIDIGGQGHIFQIVSGYGGKTKNMVSFRGVDYIRCENRKELRSIMFGKENRTYDTAPDSSIWMVVDLQQYKKENLSFLSEISLKKVLISDSYYPHIINVQTCLSNGVDLFILRGAPGKKITFRYLCQVYREQIKGVGAILELPFAVEDLEYRIRMGYEPSQGFAKLSDGYKAAVEEICLLAGTYKRGDLKKKYRIFEKRW